MPKLKTNKGVAKRVKISKNGKIKASRPGRRHLLSAKTSKRKRKLRQRMQIKANYQKSFKAVIHD